MRYILHPVDEKDDCILQVRAARSARKEGARRGFTLIEFENGKSFDVKFSDDSISVWERGA